MTDTYHSPYETCPYLTEKKGDANEDYRSPYEACPHLAEKSGDAVNGSAKYKSEYEAYPFLSDSDADIRCDFEILTDRISSLSGLLAAKCPERKEEILKVDELVYHANPSLRTHFSITTEEIEWLHSAIQEMQEEVRDRFEKFVLPAGSERGSLAHVLRVDGKQLVRALYKARERGLEFSNELIDFANLVSGYFFMLSLWLNKEDGVEEIPFVSRNYK
ncbi:MAG: ATP--cob(I)alamin adenosyltransferase [Firmicutes bacterium]|nr:ATP--cob(I)alamin adenosyltransferase [Bacillota bacterium]